MDDDHTWTVAYSVPTVSTYQGATVVTDERHEERVVATECNITVHGDLIFGSGLADSRRPLVTRAFAKGTWFDISLYA